MRHPRVTIEFCTQCRWMLRAAYFAQELLSTFSTSLGEVALQPSTGGRFVISLATSDDEVVIWDRKEKGGFPETKVLKQLVRDIIQPERDLGHSDRKSLKTEEKVVESVSNETPSVERTEPNSGSMTENSGAKASITVASQLREDAKTVCEDCQ